MVKRLPTMWETQVRSLGWEDPLEKEMATHSSILAWEIPCTEDPGRLQSVGVAKRWTRLSDFTFLFLRPVENKVFFSFCNFCHSDSPPVLPQNSGGGHPQVLSWSAAEGVESIAPCRSAHTRG